MNYTHTHTLTLYSNISGNGDRYIESGSTGVLSSLRCRYSTECEDTGHLPSINSGGSWNRN